MFLLDVSWAGLSAYGLNAAGYWTCSVSVGFRGVLRVRGCTFATELSDIFDETL
jgi:hypothetical protein